MAPRAAKKPRTSADVNQMRKDYFPMLLNNHRTQTTPPDAFVIKEGSRVIFLDKLLEGDDHTYWAVYTPTLNAQHHAYQPKHSSPTTRYFKEDDKTAYTTKFRADNEDCPEIQLMRMEARETGGRGPAYALRMGNVAVFKLFPFLQQEEHAVPSPAADAAPLHSNEIVPSIVATPQEEGENSDTIGDNQGLNAVEQCQEAETEGDLETPWASFIDDDMDCFIASFSFSSPPSPGCEFSLGNLDDLDDLFEERFS